MEVALGGIQIGLIIEEHARPRLSSASPKIDECLALGILGNRRIRIIGIIDEMC